MAIRYNIVRNHLKPGSYYPRAIRGRKVTLEAMVPNITAKTSLSESDIRGVITALIKEVQVAVSAGDTVEIDGLVTFVLGLSGSYPTAKQHLTHETAQMKLRIYPDTHLVAAVMATTKLEHVVDSVKAPVVTSFFDVSSNQFNVYTPGSIVRLQGNNLKFEPLNPDEGVFLFDGTTEHRLTVYSVNGRRQLDALVPLDITGSITVIVRARYTQHGSLREGHYDQRIECVA